jgi:hypothetical protein
LIAKEDEFLNIVVSRLILLKSIPPCMIEVQKSANSCGLASLSGVVEVLDAARRASARVVNSLMTAYWEIGRRIVEHEQGGEKRAGYGEELIEGLSHDLTQKYGRGFGVIQLRTMRQFYHAYPTPEKIQAEICQSPIDEFNRRS